MLILMSNEAHQDIDFIVHKKRNFNLFYKSYIKNNF